MMSLPDFFNPSTTVIGIIAGLISGLIIGFFTGKATAINKFKTKGDNSPIINNSSFGGK